MISNKRMKQLRIKDRIRLRACQRRPDFNCYGEALFIDDIPLSDTTDIDMLIAPEQLEGVEVYNDLNLPADLLFRAIQAVQMQIQPVDRSDSDLAPPCKTILFSANDTAS